MTRKDENSRHIYSINGMHCGGCANTVEQKLSALNGVESVKVDLEKKQVVVESSSDIDLSDLQSNLENTSYSITELDSNS